jgi:hypothetical protein
MEIRERLAFGNLVIDQQRCSPTRRASNRNGVIEPRYSAEFKRLFRSVISPGRLNSAVHVGDPRIGTPRTLFLPTEVEALSVSATVRDSSSSSSARYSGCVKP